jgi:pimeloyl-ACP methyl ester carboxylesterase
MGDYAEILAGFAAALDLDPAHVLGHSWGSTLALELWHRRPAAVRSLVLAGGYAGWAGSLPPDDMQRRLAFALQAAESAPGGFDPTSMPGLFSDVMPADRAAELAGVMADIRPAATATMARALAAADLRPMLGSIDVPTLVLHGEADVRSPTAVAEALHRAIPGSRLTVLPGLGHESSMEDADAFASALRSFLADA